ncbi:aminoglycoside phosphotransferase family protein [Streptoalloteichus hindustanus]|uniref:Phosphotransferase enzyme family protein n=1 Tax=Streptoalloteichus hindustanus TaxID=2017 RepID=A0A1M5F7B2_STRHI|nr:aminoglycoside phosphotransferase family protein [Streptoalloteichus hindustanus]SHF87463.1 Phosphotransferase enzyme family protein [Streptoalloteichus hindustanus]
MDSREIRIVGDRVIRPAHWWTPTVHALLRHLHEVGFDRVPLPLGLTDDHETLRWIPGDSGRAGWSRVVPEAGLRAFARLLRDYHEAVRGFVPPATASWALSYLQPDADPIVCHGDFGPWNVVWDDLTPVGLLDFDLAGPAARTYDVAYALEYVAPFRADAEAVCWLAHDAPPDRRRRIEVFAEEYGLTGTEGLVDAVIERQRLDAAHVAALAERGLEPQRGWVASGRLAELAGRVRWSEENGHLFR